MEIEIEEKKKSRKGYHRMWRLLKRFELQQICISSSKPSEAAEARMEKFKDFINEIRQLNDTKRLSGRSRKDRDIS